MSRANRSLGLVLVLCACHGVDAPPDVSDPTDALFDPERVLTIDISMADSDWETLRRQSRHFLDVLGDSCLVAPPERPFHYFPADVVIDGELVTRVGVRKKGFFGTLTEDRPSLKIKFSEYVPGQRFSGVTRMTLNNNLSDTSQIKQCLGYGLLARVGVPAPRCNFAVVAVNGEPLGIFTHVEPIRKPFLARHFDSADGNLYEGALSDFRPGWVDTFEKKTNDDDPDRSDIEAAVTALQVEDGELLPAVARVFDLPRFFDVWAMEVILVHADGYARNTNNFYLYRDPAAEGFVFIPWGIDVILYPDAAFPWEGSAPPGVAWAEGALSRRLYQHPETQAIFVSRVGELLDEVWDERAITAEIDRMHALLAPYYADAPEGERALIDGSIADVRAFVASRRGALEAVLDAPPAPWDRPLRDPFCLARAGRVSGEFTVGLPDAADPRGGTVELVLDGARHAGRVVSAIVDRDPAADEHALELTFRTDDDRAFTIELALGEIADATPQDVALRPGGGAVYESRSKRDGAAARALVGGGTLRLRPIGSRPRLALAGSFAASLYPTSP